MYLEYLFIANNFNKKKLLITYFQQQFKEKIIYKISKYRHFLINDEKTKCFR